MYRILAILAVLILGGCAQVASATTAYPSGLDNFTNPTGTAALSTGAGGRSHSQMHGDLNDAIEAVQAQLGVVASAVAGTVHYRLGVIETAITAWSQSSTNTVTNKTINGNNNTLTVLAGSQLSGQTPLTNGGSGANLSDPGADRLWFWDDSAGSIAWLTAGDGLTISGTTISASAPGSTALSAAITALSPTAYWRLNDASGDFQDTGGGNYDATWTGTAPTYSANALLADASTRYARFAAASGSYGGTSSLLGLTPPLTGSWSVIAVVRPLQPTGTALRYLFAINGSSETEANNDQVIVYLTSDAVTIFWEYGSGTNASITGPSLQQQQTYLLHVVKDTVANTVDVYLNGTLATTTSYANEPTGGSSATAKVMGGSGSPETLMAGAELAFFNGVAHTVSQVESVAIAAGKMGD